MARPTMRDVGVRAGVGLGTVSRVVNGSGSVRPQTAERVREAIAELGFRRNEIARALRPGISTAMIALLLGDLTNPFYAAIAKGAVEVARDAGFAVVVSTVDEDPLGEQRALQDLLGRQMAGLVVVPDQSDHSFLQEAADTGTPVVFVDRPATGMSADVVVVDNDGGGWLATQHLLDHGHERIAVLVAPSYYTTGQRLRGYRRALREAGLTVDRDLVVTLPDGTPDAAQAAVRELLGRSRPPTAVFATTGFVCEGALRALVSTPSPPAVVGFDDFRFADLLPLPATVVSVDVADLARRATQLLLERIAGRQDGPRRIVLPVSLVPRGSGERTPVPGPGGAAEG